MRPLVAVLILTTPALALEEPVPWRDPDTGCAYWLTPQGGIAPRYRRDGLPDCPDARSGASALAPFVDEPTRRNLGQALDALRREFERGGDAIRR